ncbi:protein takeout-like [Episyrphus balteatus]|uniref:protein takeout-like n=1 Tax=Episyrphus balteatus TaxID=286459 RepID=UPI0024869671|nr:protein takeout-like [Episyrphus balteatus]
MTFNFLTFSLIICLLQFSQSKDIPQDLLRCRPTDDDCLVKTANDILRSHPNGYPELNLDNLEPFSMGVIRIKGDSSKPINFDLEMTNLTISGYSKMTFTKFSGFKDEPKDLVIDTESFVDEIEIKGKYKVSGKMLLFPITGDGDLSVKIYGLQVKFRAKPKVEVRNGKEYLRSDYYKIKAKADKMTVKCSNLFNGDKVLSESMHKILNENWQVLFEEMHEDFANHLAKVNGDTLDKTMKDFAYNEIFSKDLIRCRPTDDECLVKVANDILHSHPNGYPELNIDNLEPSPIGAIKIKGDSSKPVNFDLEMTNLTFSGYSKMTFTKFSGFKNEPKDLVIDTESLCDEAEIKGKYKVSGKMLLFPITGDGDISIKINGLHIKSRSKPKTELRDGKEYLKTDYYKIKAKADHMTVKCSNLFNGDKVLSESMHKILNENWQVLWEEMEASFDEQLSKVNGETLDKVMNDFPYKELFLID